MPSLSTFFDSLEKGKVKLINMGTLKISKNKYRALIIQGSKNAKSKEKQIVKGKNPKSDNEDEGSKPTNEGSISMKKVKKKGTTSKCSYYNKGFHSEKKCFKKKMDIIIMSRLLEKHNIKVLDELEKPVESPEHCHGAQFPGNINYALSARVKFFPHISDIDSFSDISKSEISMYFLDKSPISPLDPSPNACVFSLDPDLSLSNSFSLH